MPLNIQLLQRIVDLHGHNFLVHCLHNAAVQDIRGLRHSCVTDKNIKVLAAVNLKVTTRNVFLLWRRSLSRCFSSTANLSTCSRQELSGGTGCPRWVKSWRICGCWSLNSGTSATRKASTNLPLKYFFKIGMKVCCRFSAVFTVVESSFLCFADDWWLSTLKHFSQLTVWQQRMQNRSPVGFARNSFGNSLSYCSDLLFARTGTFGILSM